MTAARRPGAPAGERNGRARLTAAAAAAIRARYAGGGITQKELARAYRVSRRTICRVLAGDTWTPMPEGAQDAHHG